MAPFSSRRAVPDDNRSARLGYTLFFRESSPASEFRTTASIKEKPEIGFAADGEGYGGGALIILGIICLILGAIFNLGFLWVIGGILIVLGVIFWILGAMGRAVGGRRHYY